MWGNHTARGRLTPRGGERVTPPVSAQRRGQVSERVGESPRPWDSARAHVCTTGWQPALRPGRPVSVGITSLQSSPYLEPSAPTHTVLMVCVARPPRGMPHTLLARAPCCVWHPSLRLAAKHAPTAPVHAHPLSLPLQARAGHRRWQRPCWRRAQAVSVPSGLDVAGEASRPPPPVGEVGQARICSEQPITPQSLPASHYPGGGGLDINKAWKSPCRLALSADQHCKLATPLHLCQAIRSAAGITLCLRGIWEAGCPPPLESCVGHHVGAQTNAAQGLIHC